MMSSAVYVNRALGGAPVDESKVIQMLQINPRGLENISDATEAMQLAAVTTNGLALAYCHNPSDRVVMAAIEENGRAVEYIQHPSESILEFVIDKGWNYLEYIDSPSEAIVKRALAQSGWAIKYVKNPSEELQLLAVETNFDAIQYIENPTQQVQEMAIRHNYQALRYIKVPTFASECLAVREHEKAMRFISDVTMEKVLQLLTVNSLIIKYVPHNLLPPVEAIRKALATALGDESVCETYVRQFMTVFTLDDGQGNSLINKLALVDTYGSAKAKRIAMDERLAFK